MAEVRLEQAGLGALHPLHAKGGRILGELLRVVDNLAGDAAHVVPADHQQREVLRAVLGHRAPPRPSSACQRRIASISASLETASVVSTTNPCSSSQGSECAGRSSTTAPSGTSRLRARSPSWMSPLACRRTTRGSVG